MKMETVSLKDMYEDDNVVIVHRTSKIHNTSMLSIDVCTKDESGDITQVISVKDEIL